MARDKASITRATLSRLYFTITLTATACGGQGPADPVPTDSADLAVTLVVAESGNVGTMLNTRVRVANAGPDEVEEVVVTVSITGPGSVEPPPGTSLNGTTLEWQLPSPLGSGESQSLDFPVSLDGAGDVVLNARAAAPTPDPDPSNNDGSAAASTASILVSVAADLRLVVSSPASALAGDTVDIDVLAVNSGPSPASDVEVSVALSAGSRSVSVGQGGSEVSSVVSWPTIPELVGGDSIAYSMRVIVPAVGPGVWSGSVTSTTPDPNLANNSGGSAVGRTLVTFDYLYAVHGAAVGDEFGWEVEPLGNINGDAVPDFAVAETGVNGGDGRVSVRSGVGGGVLYTFAGQGGDRFGVDLDGDGDIDGDGVRDLVVGGPGAGAGRAVVYSLATGTRVFAATGENAGDLFGWNAAFTGDVNGDMVPDIVVGAPGWSGSTGRLYVYSGGDNSLLYTVDGPTGSRFGHTARGIGDVNGDGVSDIGVGAPNAGVGGSGELIVLSGVDGAQLYSVEAEGTGSNFGEFWVSSPGDLNGDSVPDIYAADLGDNAGGTNAGAWYAISGTDGSIIHYVTGDSPGGQLGVGHPAGDIDGDGVGDIISAAWVHNEGGSSAGKVYVFSGVSGEPIRSWTCPNNFCVLGFDAVVIGDVTGDGIADYAFSGNISAGRGGTVWVVAGP